MLLPARRGLRGSPSTRAVIPKTPVQQDWKALGNYGTLGLEIALSVGVGLFGGQWLDKKLGTGGWLTWIGFAYGLAAAGRAIYRAVRKSTREAEELERREQEARQKYADDTKHQ